MELKSNLLSDEYKDLEAYASGKPYSTRQSRVSYKKVMATMIAACVGVACFSSYNSAPKQNLAL